jgi:hypothetical protein
MNTKEVRAALHISEKAHDWSGCGDIDYTMSQNGSQWIYEKLANKYRMLKYSGDADGVVPTEGTKKWIAEVGWKVIQDWTPYYYGTQVAGFFETREN